MPEKVGSLRRVLGIGALALVTATAGLTVLAGPAAAAGRDLYVATTGSDTDNDCTDVNNPCEHIQYAIEDQAQPNDTLHVGAGTYDESEITVDLTMTIVGATDGTTTVDGAGEGVFGVFGGDSVPSVTFENLNISGNTEGEGVLVAAGDAHFVNTHVDNNAAGGVIAAEATIEATGSTFSGNGDPQDASFLTGSGLLLLFGRANVDHSTFDANLSSGITVFPFNIFEGPRQSLSTSDLTSSVSVSHSTVSNNEFGGVLALESSIEVAQSTVSGNVGYGIDNAGGVATVENSTVTGTTPIPQSEPGVAKPADVASTGAGIETDQVNTDAALTPSTKALDAVASRIRAALPASAATPSPRITHRIAAADLPSDLRNGQTEVTGTIVAKQAGVPDCFGGKDANLDGGFNLSSDAANSCTFAAEAGDFSKTDPKLGPLADNGGATKTHLIAKGSPAIDAIPAGSANCASTADDQRGVSRPQGSKCDIGAVEAAQTPIVITPNTLPHGTVDKAYSVTLTATGGLGAPYEFSLAPHSGPLPAGLTLSTAGKISGTPTRAGNFPITISVDDPTLKQYTIVIAAAVVPTSSSAAPIVANTGADVKPLTVYGLLALVLGALLTVGGVARYAGRHRAH